MRSGRETLSSLDEALREVRRQGHELDQRIQRTSKALLALRQRETEKYKALARVRLETLRGEGLIGDLDDAELRVGELLAQRERELSSLASEIEAAEKALGRLEAKRSAQAKRVERAQQELDRGEAATQGRLKDDPAFVAQLERTRAADATAAEAEAKTQQAESDRVEKGRPYEADPLFSYLFARGFGTSRYSAFPLTRFLDRKVARLCGYQEARPNYQMLLEIPRRLAEHAQRVREAAAQELEALRKMEEDAARSDGVAELRTALDDAQNALAQIDERIQSTESEIDGLVQQRARYASGEDESYTRAVELLRAGFERHGIASLRHRAAATGTREDDLLVHELADLDDERARLEDELARHRDLHARHLTRLQELEQVRRDFKHNDYDDAQSVFGDEDLVIGILNEFLRGVASSGDLWGTIRRHHRRGPMRSDPDFGTGGFGGRGSTWRIPRPGRSGSMGGRGGGFRTGGGF